MLDHEIKNLQRRLERMSKSEYELAKKDPVSLLAALFETMKQLFLERKQDFSKVSMFIEVVLRRPMLRSLFLLALYQGVYGVQRTAQQQEVRNDALHSANALTGGTRQVYISQSEFYAIISIYTCTMCMYM